MQPDSVQRTNAALDKLPLPSPAEVARRTNLFRQARRFVALNVKILRLTRHH